MSARSGLFQAYYKLSKPGIIRGNLLTATAGFFLASDSSFELKILFAMWLGLALVIASAAVFNNYIDRSVDNKMNRTKNRALVTGQISGKSALSYATIVGVLGTLILYNFTNWLATFAALAGLFLYVVVYSLWGKRNSVHGTELGSLSGAIPPVVGYTAVSGQIDKAAIILFLMLVFWQMPHFYSIAIYRLKDYRAAQIPVLPTVKGISTTKKYILAYIPVFAITALLLPIFSHVEVVYSATILLLSSAWLVLGIKNFNNSDNQKWGKNMFLFSLVVISITSITISLESILA